MAKDVSLFSASLNGDKKLCDNNEGHIFAGAFLIIGAHFFVTSNSILSSRRTSNETNKMYLLSADYIGNAVLCYSD